MRGHDRNLLSKLQGSLAEEPLAFAPNLSILPVIKSLTALTSLIMYRASELVSTLPATEVIVGKSMPRKEGLAKVKGEAQYVDDLTYPDMLHGKTIRSTLARGVITEIKFDPAFDWSRVIVADYRDIPGRNVVALIEDDQPLLVEKEVQHHDEPILLLACKERETLEEAAKHIQISYQEKPALLSPGQALAAGEQRDASLIIHKNDNIINQSPTAASSTNHRQSTPIN